MAFGGTFLLAPATPGDWVALYHGRIPVPLQDPFWLHFIPFRHDGANVKFGDEFGPLLFFEARCLISVLVPPSSPTSEEVLFPGQKTTHNIRFTPQDMLAR